MMFLLINFKIFDLGKDSSRYERDTHTDFRYLWNYKKYQEVLLKTSEEFQKLCKIPKFEGPGLKTVYHCNLYFELKMAITSSIFQLKRLQ